jgi:L-2-hydroxyglutarate oxidase LhgO
MLSLQGELEAAGGQVAVRTTVESLAADPSGVELTLDAGGERSDVLAGTVINAAGLGAAALAGRCRGLGSYVAPTTYFAKGNYFAYAGASPFTHLVYPLPVDGGLGVHATLDLAGRLRFGPDVEWVDNVDYAVDPSRADTFYSAIRDYWPALPDESLTPAYAGIRPKLAGPGEAVADFRIEQVYRNAGTKLIALYGIESPGLTASLAIAAQVRSLAETD